MAEVITPEELKALIEQTYQVENEYKALRSDYAYLLDTIEQVVEFIPNAIWILEENGEVVYSEQKIGRFFSEFAFKEAWNFLKKIL